MSAKIQAIISLEFAAADATGPTRFLPERALRWKSGAAAIGPL